MREKYVTLETAKLAAEKGFDIETRNADYMVNGNYPGEVGACVSCTEYVPCPNQTLLQKWLRETHQIYVDIDIDQTTYPKFCYMISRFIGNPTNLAAEEWDWENLPNGENWHLHRKWEDALEEGLFEALKLI
jgi:hypothetical protein